MSTRSDMLEEFIQSRHTTDNFENGRAGLLLSMLFLCRGGKEEWMETSVRSCLDKLIATSVISNEGIYWPDFYCHIKGLNGFFHGAAGVGLALNMSGKLTGNKYLLYLAKEAFNYVSSTYDKETGTWACMEKGIRSADDYSLHKEKLLSGELDFFTIPRYDESFGVELCYRLSHAQFNADVVLSITEKDARLRFLSTHYFRTITFLEKFCSKELNNYLATDFSFEGFNELDEFSNWIANLRIDENLYERLIDVHSFETARIALSKNAPSLALLHIRRLVRIETAHHLLNDPVEDLLFETDPELEFYETKWNWQALCAYEQQLNTPPGEHTMLLTASEKGKTIANILNDLQHALLSIFSSAQTVREAIETCCSLLETTTANRPQHEELIESHIRDMIQKGWICVPQTVNMPTSPA